jgi:hypothetical protein
MVITAALGAAMLLRPPQAAGQEACGVLRDEGLVAKVQAKLLFSAYGPRSEALSSRRTNAS